MLNEKEVILICETLLSSPGMNDTVKIDLRLTRKQVLLLARIIEKGVQGKQAEQADSLANAVGSGVMEELQKVTTDLLQKAGLAEMNEKLNALQPNAK
jgi:hypothetical protein